MDSNCRSTAVADHARVVTVLKSPRMFSRYPSYGCGSPDNWFTDCPDSQRWRVSVAASRDPPTFFLVGDPRSTRGTGGKRVTLLHRPGSTRVQRTRPALAAIIAVRARPDERPRIRGRRRRDFGPARRSQENGDRRSSLAGRDQFELPVAAWTSLRRRSRQRPICRTA